MSDVNFLDGAYCKGCLGPHACIEVEGDVTRIRRLLRLTCIETGWTKFAERVAAAQLNFIGAPQCWAGSAISSQA